MFVLFPPGVHGDSGPLVITESAHSELARTFIKAGTEVGYTESDLSGEADEGVSLMQATVNNGMRWSTAKAYLRPVIARHNLHVATLAPATKVLVYVAQSPRGHTGTCHQGTSICDTIMRGHSGTYHPGTSICDIISMLPLWHLPPRY